MWQTENVLEAPLVPQEVTGATLLKWLFAGAAIVWLFRGAWKK